MFGFEFKGFTDLQKGYVALFFGTVLLLHTLNLFREWFNGLFIIVAVALIIYGIIKSHIIGTTLTFIKRERKQSKIAES